MRDTILTEENYVELALESIGSDLHRDAVLYLEKAISLNPLSEKAVLVRVDLFIITGDKTKALECLESYGRLLEDRLEAFSKMGNYYYQKCDYKQMRYWYKKILKSVASDVFSLFMISLSYILEQKWKSAIRYLGKLLHYDPNNIDGMYFLGMCHNNIGQYSRAIEEFQSIITIDKNYKNGLFGLAIANENIGNIKESVNYLKKYISDNHSFSAYCILWSIFNEILKNDESARKYGNLAKKHCYKDGHKILTFKRFKKYKGLDVKNGNLYLNLTQEL